MTAELDRVSETTVFVVTALDRDGIRRDLWFGKSLRGAVKQQNVVLPAKLRTLYREYELEERACAA